MDIAGEHIAQRVALFFHAARERVFNAIVRRNLRSTGDARIVEAVTANACARRSEEAIPGQFQSDVAEADQRSSHLYFKRQYSGHRKEEAVFRFDLLREKDHPSTFRVDWPAGSGEVANRCVHAPILADCCTVKLRVSSSQIESIEVWRQARIEHGAEWDKGGAVLPKQVEIIFVVKREGPIPGNADTNLAVECVMPLRRLICQIQSTFETEQMREVDVFFGKLCERIDKVFKLSASFALFCGL